MSEELMVKNCSPTLAGIKTGNMFSCGYKDIKELKTALRAWNRSLVKKGLRVVPLKAEGGRALIYVYRPKRLVRDWDDVEAAKILCERGYNPKSAEISLNMLIKKLREKRDFPHEVGLFLGYPPEDVKGFIENRADNFKCVGCWKVYGDVEKAKKIFEKYKKCTDVYCAQYAKGSNISKLTVAV